MASPVRIPVTARPGSSKEAVEWDPWRRSWVVRIREPAEAGRANDAILRALARWLSVPPGSVRWVRAGRSTSKVAEVLGPSPEEVAQRLGSAAEHRRRLA